MERISPKLKDNRNIPVNIFKGETLVKEAVCIQDAAKWLKQDTKQHRYSWSAINKGIWENKSYSYNGVTYFFTTDPQAVVKKKENEKTN